MLDGKHAVIAAQTQVGDHISPIGLAVAVAHGTEYPRAVDLVAVVLGIQHAVLGGVVMVDLGILCMEVIDRALQLADSSHGIHALPYQVRGVKVCTDDVTNRCTQLKQRFGVVHAEAGVHFECNVIYTVRLCKCACFLPIRNQNLIPLPIQDLEEVIRPGAGDPVGVLGTGCITGAAREGNDRVNPHLFCQQHCLAEILIIGCSDFGIGMHGIAVYCQRANADVVFCQSGNKCIVLSGICKQLCRVAVRLAGVAARAKLYGVYAKACNDGQRLIQGFLSV